MLLTQENSTASISVNSDPIREIRQQDKNVYVPHILNHPVPKTMFQVGDCVQHQLTGSYGKVIGYGHEILDGVYLPTLKVRVLRNTGLSQKGFVEDLFDVWMPLKGE